MTRLRQIMLDELQGRKILVVENHPLVLGWFEDSAVRFDNQGVGVAESSSR